MIPAKSLFSGYCIIPSVLNWWHHAICVPALATSFSLRGLLGRSRYFAAYSALEASRLQAKLMGNMSSFSAAVECTAGPVLGRLSDTVGRKKMLLISPLVQAGCHASVAAFPGVRWIMFLDRVFSGAGLYMHMMLSNAVLSDLFESQELAQIRVLKQSMFSGALIIGPLLGNLLGNRIGKPQMAFA
eukprot:COSAG02_NODE_1021_length_15159_cov_24.514739_10_plen_186_part_00